MSTIAIDFDGVIHDYKEGWRDGSIYGDSIPGAMESIRSLMDKGFSVFIHSTRNSRQIREWIKMRDSEGMYYISKDVPCDPLYGIQIIPFWIRFWNKKYVLGITRRKLPAIVYIDDRAYKFRNWEETNKFLKNEINTGGEV